MLCSSGWVLELGGMPTPAVWYGYPVFEVFLSLALLDLRRNLKPVWIFFLKKLLFAVLLGVAGALYNLVCQFYILFEKWINVKLIDCVPKIIFKFLF